MCHAVPCKIRSIEGDVGRVEVGGVIREVNLSLLDDPKVGDWVIIHTGFALSSFDPQEAMRTLNLMAAAVPDAA